MASHFSDDMRRADILRRTRAGLQEDLDDLRADLADALPEYEQRLGELSQGLPSWLEIAPAELRQLFHLQMPAAPGALDDEGGDPGIIGPRVVALAAGHVEGFIEQWMSPADAEQAETLPPEHQDLTRAYAQITDYLDSVFDQSRLSAEQAQATMDFWLDSTLAQLDSQRENDVEALEELVHQGDIRRGQRARQEIADRWEEQRRQAAELQQRWRPLLALLGEGLELSEAGTEELADLLARARDGLVGAFPQLAERLPPYAFEPAGVTSQMPAADHALSGEDEPHDEAGPTAQINDLAHAHPDTAPPGETLKMLQEPADAPRDGTDERDEAHEHHEYDDTHEHEVEPDDPAAPAEPATLQPDSFHAPADTSYAGVIPLDEPSSEPEWLGLESSSVSAYSEPSIDEVSEQSAKTSPARTAPHAAKDAPEQPRTTERLSPAPAELAPAKAAPVAPPQTPQKTMLDADDEATFSSCFRVRQGYKPVHFAEVLAVLGPPSLLLGGMALLCALYLAGFDASNPLERWPWAMSALAVAAAWLFLLPTGLRWRSKWRGARPIILRYTDVREQVELVFDARGLRLGRESWRWEEVVRASLRRWDSPLDEVCGWALSLQLPGAQPLELAAPEPNRKKWQNAPYQLGDVPYQAWQVDIFDFEAICRRTIG